MFLRIFSITFYSRSWVGQWGLRPQSSGRRQWAVRPQRVECHQMWSCSWRTRIGKDRAIVWTIVILFFSNIVFWCSVRALGIFSASGSFHTKKVERTFGEIDSQRRNPLKLSIKNYEYFLNSLYVKKYEYFWDRVVQDKGLFFHCM